MVGFVFLTLAAVINVANAEVSRIDLEIESIQLIPYTPNAQQPVQVVARIRNSGTEEANNVYVSYTLWKQGEKIKTVEDIPVLSHLPRMGSGLSEPVSIGMLVAGSYKIEMSVYLASKKENNENNNTRAITFRVA